MRFEIWSDEDSKVVPIFLDRAMAAEAPALPDALDEPGPSLANGNGSAEERVHGLEAELAQTKRDRDGFEAQYRSLLGKLTTMRNTLGDKLKQDAVCVSDALRPLTPPGRAGPTGTGDPRPAGDERGPSLHGRDAQD